MGVQRVLNEKASPQHHTEQIIAAVKSAMCEARQQCLCSFMCCLAAPDNDFSAHVTACHEASISIN